MEAGEQPAKPSPLWRRALPFVLAIGLVGFVVSRVDFPAFTAALGRANVPAFAGFVVVFIACLLTADAFATSVVYRRAVAPVSFKEMWLLRGGSYLPSLLNHHLGQAFVTIRIARRHKVSIARVAGGTLLVYASWMGCILGIGVVALIVRGDSWLFPGAIIGTGLAYLTVIAIRPAALARFTLLSPLFEAGVRGHVVALAARAPHAAVMFLGTWLPFLFFGVDIPLSAALAGIPLLMVAVTLPLTPQGFGTRDALAGVLFAAWAPGDRQDQRLAAIAAATAAFGVAVTLVELALAAVLLRSAMRDEAAS